MTPKRDGSEDHACNQLEFLWSLADFCESAAWIEEEEEPEDEDDWCGG